MDQKVLLELKKFEEKNRKEKSGRTLPSSFLFTDRKKISDFRKTINSLPRNSAIIIREYDLNKKDREIFARKISALTKSKSLKIIVGKDFSLAKKIKADGVHFSDYDKLPLQILRRKSFDKKFIFTFSCHDFKSVLRSKLVNPDIVFISPVFSTTSHLNAKNLGIKNLAKIYLKSKNRVYFQPRFYALGGLNSKNLSSVRKLGLSGFAAIDLFNRL